MNSRAAALWAQTKLHVWPERYWLVSLPLEAWSEATGLAAGCAKEFAALVRERDEASLTIEESAWQASGLRRLARAEAGPYRAVSLDVEIDLDVTGYLAPAAARLAEANVSIVPQCAYLKDHLLIHEEQLALA
ncbi:MAG TPA: hypothetical protein VFG76_00900, partial [Candidatus Polarisedimenticolia bacterium]|nr:hypothetical protein [Candidatus Polarisedimenticolia bacterium]